MWIFFKYDYRMGYHSLINIFLNKQIFVLSLFCFKTRLKEGKLN